MSPCMRCAQTAVVSHMCYHDSHYVRQMVDPTDIWEFKGINYWDLSLDLWFSSLLPQRTLGFQLKSKPNYFYLVNFLSLSVGKSRAVRHSSSPTYRTSDGCDTRYLVLKPAYAALRRENTLPHLRSTCVPEGLAQGEFCASRTWTYCKYSHFM